MIKVKKRRGNRREINFNLNGNIKAEKLRLIDENGEQLGIVDTRSALNKASDKGLDLYVISEKADPPVAKILDYGKYKYEKQKKFKESKKKSSVIKVKEIRLSTFIEEHDLNVKAKRAIEFLIEGNSIKVSLRFKGREMGYQERGKENISKFKELIQEFSTEKGEAKLEGRVMHANFEPIKSKIKKNENNENSHLDQSEVDEKENVNNQDVNS